MKSVENVTPQLITHEKKKERQDKGRESSLGGKDEDGTMIISQSNQFTRETHYSKWQQKAATFPFGLPVKCCLKTD